MFYLNCFLFIIIIREDGLMQEFSYIPQSKDKDFNMKGSIEFLL